MIIKFDELLTYKANRKNIEDLYKTVEDHYVRAADQNKFKEDMESKIENCNVVLEKKVKEFDKLKAKLNTRIDNEMQKLMFMI